jgi:hypothetical protein
LTVDDIYAHCQRIVEGHEPCSGGQEHH